MRLVLQEPLMLVWPKDASAGSYPTSFVNILRPCREGAYSAVFEESRKELGDALCLALLQRRGCGLVVDEGRGRCRDGAVGESSRTPRQGWEAWPVVTALADHDRNHAAQKPGACDRRPLCRDQRAIPRLLHYRCPRPR